MQSIAQDWLDMSRSIKTKEIKKWNAMTETTPGVVAETKIKCFKFKNRLRGLDYNRLLSIVIDFC